MKTALRCSMLALLLALSGTASAVAPTEAALAARALAAARQADWTTLDQLQAELGQAFPLQAYLDFHRLSQHLDNTPAEAVQAYLYRHADSPVAASLRRQAMDHYGRRGQWADLRAVSNGSPETVELRCLYYRAHLDSDPAYALAGARQLWLSGESRPADCDPLFAALKRTGALDDALVWQRLLLTWPTGHGGRLRYLASLLQDPDWQASGQRLLQLQRQPARVADLSPGPGSADLAVLALQRLAGQDPVRARQLLPVLQQRLALDAEASRRAGERIAWYSALRQVPENQAWLQAWLQSQPEPGLLELHLRRTIAAQDWPALEGGIALLPEAQQRSARWRYWLAQHRLQQGQTEAATALLQQAAGERSFWGFLAAERLGLPPSLNNRPLIYPQPAADAASERTLQRVALLLAIDEPAHAREEWRFHLRRNSDPQQARVLAQAALAQGWHHLLIDTALHQGQHDALDWRFPPAYRELFQQAADRHGLDSWLLMAVARRESAFDAQARSRAGAQGLMQLMPATAREVARRLGDPGLALAVLEPAANIELGSRYLAELLQRYDGNRILALAAYNAGPQRVDRWLQDGGSRPFDAFIESIPFQETRDYVQAVLAYRVIFSRHRDDTLLALLNADERSRPYNPGLLAAHRTTENPLAQCEAAPALTLDC